MAALEERVAAELENVEKALAALPDETALPALSRLELGGTAALLHSFYNGVENIVKQIVLAHGLTIPTGASWHRDLLELAVERKLIAAHTRDSLAPYLAFRHFFVHGYSVDLRADLLAALVRDARQTLALLRRDIPGNAPRRRHA
jgi:uncharacterized protein YutE (UPF0331/DUF86 family)